MDRNFTVNRKELTEALTILEPYIALPPQKEQKDDEEESNRITIPKPYFGDKVTFSFNEYSTKLSVFTNDTHVEVTCHTNHALREMAFCMSLPYLLQELKLYEAENIRFEEDPFFGFVTYNADIRFGKNRLFEVEAFSVRKQKSFYPLFFDTLYPYDFCIEKESFVDCLKDLYKYCAETELRKQLTACWFYIENGECNAIASNGHIMAMKTFRTQGKGTHSICVPGNYAMRIVDDISNWSPQILRISYNDNYVNFYDFDTSKNRGISIDVPRLGKEGIQVQETLNNQTIIHKATLKTKDLLSCVKGIKTFAESSTCNINILLHFLNNHVNIHYTDTISDKSTSAFLDVEDCHDVFFTKLNVASLNILLSDIYTDNLDLYFTNKDFLYILNDDEEFMGNTFRLMCPCKHDDYDIKILEKMDASLTLHKKYEEKYL